MGCLPTPRPEISSAVPPLTTRRANDVPDLSLQHLPLRLKRLDGLFLITYLNPTVCRRIQVAQVQKIRHSFHHQICDAEAHSQSADCRVWALHRISLVVPLIGCCSPRSKRNRVVLPAPLGPITATNSPRLMAKLASRHTMFRIAATRFWQ